MASSKSGSNIAVVVLASLLMLVVGGIGSWYVFTQRGGQPGQSGETFTLAEGEIFMEPAAAVGPNPFVAAPLAPPPDPALAAPVVQENARVEVSQPVSVQANSGAQPGLYGGTRSETVCDTAQLVSFLGANPDKASAWVSALNADATLRFDGGTLTAAAIPTYVAGLTSLVLLADTRVTNHGFDAGRPTPRQSVLQKGSAVLIDPYGVPRARCYCGNPLIPPVPSKVQPVYVGSSWAGFDPAAVAVVAPAPQPQVSFQVKDPSGTVVTVTIGSPSTAAGQPTTAAVPGQPTTAPGTAATTAAVAAGQPTAAGAAPAPAQAPYTSQVIADPMVQISAPIPAGWETRPEIAVKVIDGQDVIHMRLLAAPNLALLNDPDPAIGYSQSFVQINHYWPSTPGQPLDPKKVLEAVPSKFCTLSGSQEPFNHPEFGSGWAITYSGCPDPSAEARTVVVPQVDGSVILVTMTVHEERDRSYINTVLDSVAVPTVSAPAAPNVPRTCSDETAPNLAGARDVPVTNNTSQPLRIYWHEVTSNGCSLRDAAGDAIVVGPGQTKSLQGSSEGAAWSAVALDGSEVDKFVVPATGGAWDIR